MLLFKRSLALILCACAGATAAGPATHPAASQKASEHRLQIKIVARAERLPAVSLDGAAVEFQALPAALRRAKYKPGRSYPSATNPAHIISERGEPYEEVSCDIEYPPELAYEYLVPAYVACAQAGIKRIRLTSDNKSFLSVTVPVLENLAQVPKPKHYRKMKITRSGDALQVTFGSQTVTDPAQLKSMIQAPAADEKAEIVIAPQRGIVMKELLPYAEAVAKEAPVVLAPP
jgi:hypothetical protein